MPDYAFMNQCLYEGKAKEVEQMTKNALAEGRSVKEVLEEGLIAGMVVVGENFKHNILYVPEVLIAARAMKAGMAVLKPLLNAGGPSSQTGRLLMGTVRGDLHDIRKNLVCMMAEGAGFVVKDIGVDQSVEEFAAAADEFKPDIVGMNALVTTTMTYMNTRVGRSPCAAMHAGISLRLAVDASQSHKISRASCAEMTRFSCANTDRFWHVTLAQKHSR